ncbi:MAG: hypothetical protein LBI27_02990, partial [Clostridiales bacterium]|nr:hypothetical protein [Clostridiales bacterium]
MKLKAKIIAPVLVLLFFATVGITAMNYWNASQSVRTMKDNIIESGLDTLTSQMAHSIKIEEVVNEEMDERLLASAQTFAEIVRLRNENGTLDYNDFAMFQRTADFLGMSEINVTDAEGTIIGTNILEGNIGFNYGTSESTLPYMQILTNRDYVRVELPRASATPPYTVYQYAGVARIDGEGFVQVGLSVDVIKEYSDMLDVINLARDMRIGESGRATVIREGLIAYSQVSSKIGGDVTGEPWYSAVTTGERGRTELEIDGIEYYAGYINISGTTVLLLFPKSEYYGYLM